MTENKTRKIIGILGFLTFTVGMLIPFYQSDVISASFFDLLRETKSVGTGYCPIFAFLWFSAALLAFFRISHKKLVFGLNFSLFFVAFAVADICRGVENVDHDLASGPRVMAVGLILVLIGSLMDDKIHIKEE